MYHKKIIFVHLLNDYSGSPKVLSQVIDDTHKEGYEVELYTGKSGEGLLTKCIQNHYFYFYKRFDNKMMTLISFMLSQTDIFFKLLKYKNQDVVIYINTMLPFGAGLAGKVLKKKVYYHIHETSLSPQLLKKFLRFIIQHTASKIIFVSNSLKEAESFNNIEHKVIYNTLSTEFLKKSLGSNYTWRDKNGIFNILMICSIKAYKGIYEFIQIAKLCEYDNSIKFILVLNAQKVEIDDYFESMQIPLNVALYDKQKVLHKFYEQANLVLNLSRVDQWIETFGLTILEAISYGIPCIVPPVGGPVELIDNGVNGYCINSYDVKKIAKTILEISKNENLALKLSKNAKEKAMKFNPDEFKVSILEVFNEK